MRLTVFKPAETERILRLRKVNLQRNEVVMPAKFTAELRLDLRLNG